jgi:hypothetical protein
VQALSPVVNNDYQSKQNQVTGLSPQVMTKIYEAQCNLVLLQRFLPKEIDAYCHELIDSNCYINLRFVIDPKQCLFSLSSSLPDLAGKSEFIEDLALLVDMYSCLFDLDEVGFRLQVLDRAMCPRFHIDKLGCRLVSTYLGKGTQWLFNNDVDRSKLGVGNRGLSDDQSGIIADPACIQNVNQGDVVLLKGEGWYANEGLGIVHRSPPMLLGEKRIVVTMDFA